MAGAVITVVAEPEGCVVTLKPLPVAVPEEHAYEMARVMPGSATCGWQEICGVGGTVFEPGFDDGLDGLDGLPG